MYYESNRSGNVVQLYIHNCDGSSRLSVKTAFKLSVLFEFVVEWDIRYTINNIDLTNKLCIIYLALLEINHSTSLLQSLNPHVSPLDLFAFSLNARTPCKKHASSIFCSQSEHKRTQEKLL